MNVSGTILSSVVCSEDMPAVIRTPLDSSSFAGFVYLNNVALNVADAYKDPRFNASSDAVSLIVCRN